MFHLELSLKCKIRMKDQKVRNPRGVGRVKMFGVL
jgi:hypothetical protein